MAVAVQQKVAEVQAEKAKPSRYEITYRRRFWDVNTASYKLEATSTTLPSAEIQDISSSREALDRKGINVFESSNITIELENIRNKWQEGNQAGLLSRDDTARIGYEPILMEFVVDVFYTFRDSSESDPITMFRGRAVDFDFRPNDDTVSITLESEAILLKRADAENVSTDRDNIALIGTLDGINTTFTTAHNGVASVSEVRVGGLIQRLGADVVVSNLNDPDNPATFEFVGAPAIGSDPRADYTTWLFDQNIEDLVGLLADEAGIGPAFRDIQPVSYPNLVLNKEIVTTQPDWDSGTLVNIESQSQPGSILLQDLTGAFGLIDDFEDGDFSSDPTWTVSSGTWSILSAFSSKSLASDNLFVLQPNEIILPFTANGGTWEFIHAFTDPGNQIPFIIAANTPFQGGRFRFMEDLSTGNYYELHIQSVNFSINRQFFLNKVIGGVPTTLATIVVGVATYQGSQEHLWRITLDRVTGQFRVYLNGSLILSAVEPVPSLIPSSDQMRLQADSATGQGSRHFFDNFRHIPDVLALPNTVPDNGTWEGPIIDTGPGNPLAWGLFDHSDVLPPGTGLLYETKTSTDGINFDPYIPISPGNVILSAVKRFIRVRVTFTTDPGKTLTPIISEIAINFSTQSTAIRLANFNRLTVFNAITELAKIANFEWGISRAGRLFFRARTTNPVPVLMIQLKDLADFRRITDGSERVFNKIRAAYGNHEKIVTPISRNDSGPNSFDRFGVKSLDVGSTQLLLDPDADIATGLSISYFEEFKNPRRGFELDIDFRPQLELADTVLLRILDAVPDPKWHIGDSSRAVGDQDISLYGDKQQSAYDIRARVLSLRNSIGSMKTGLELEEII